MRAIHLARSARAQYDLKPTELAPSGALSLDDLPAARAVATRLNAARAAGKAAGPPTVTGGELAALATLHEIYHHVLRAAVGGDPAAGTAEASPAPLRKAADSLAAKAGSRSLDAVERALRADFGGPAGEPLSHPRPRRGRRAVAPAEPVPAPADTRADLLEELVLLAITNDNPAVAPLRDLVDDRPLRRRTRYLDVVKAAEDALDAAVG